MDTNAQLLIDHFFAALAAITLASIWLNSSVFEEYREKVGLWRLSNRLLSRLVGYLLTCRLCLTLQLQLWIYYLLVVFPAWSTDPWLMSSSQFILYFLASAAFVALFEKE